MDDSAFDVALQAIRDAHAGETAALRQRAEAAEQRADEIRVLLAETTARADRAEAAAADAHQRANAAEVKAQRADEELAYERMRVGTLQREVAGHLAMVTEAAHGLEAVRFRAREAEREADQLRQADAARKRRGRWARLWAAWRAE